VGGKGHNKLLYQSSEEGLHLSLENTDQQINRDLAVSFLIDRLPDCYKSEGQTAKQQNLPFVATTAYPLANIKDNSTAGDNTSGQHWFSEIANLAEMPAINLETVNDLRANPTVVAANQQVEFLVLGIHITCSWCKRRGHKERLPHQATPNLVLVKHTSATIA
jgi:hypothetical protein